MMPLAILQIPTLAQLVNAQAAGFTFEIRFGSGDHTGKHSGKHSGDQGRTAKPTARTKQTRGQPTGQTQRRSVLNISYNEPILRTRHAILEEAGLAVVSALGFSEGLELCSTSKQKFDLVVIGPSLPEKDKTVLISAVRDLCDCPILSLRRPGSEPHPDADYSADSGDGPEGLLTTIEDIFRGRIN
jgi:hypothetical protein